MTTLQLFILGITNNNIYWTVHDTLPKIYILKTIELKHLLYTGGQRAKDEELAGGLGEKTEVLKQKKIPMLLVTEKNASVSKRPVSRRHGTLLCRKIFQHHIHHNIKDIENK